jgi:site-specific DNA-methyltransferase (adenine-specific)
MVALPEPYYDRDGITIYHADCRDILPLIDPGSVDLVLTDPPYGIALDTENRTRQRSALALANDYIPVHMDDVPFDPEPLMRFSRLILFGANHYATRLPESPSWIVWDKTAGLRSNRSIGFNDNADAELIWTNLGGPVRILGHQWIGLMKATERGEPRVHPTQKPTALIRWMVSEWSTGTILDPFMGSGTTLRAAKDLGRKAIGIEIEERYCEIAVKRLAQQVLPMVAD